MADLALVTAGRVRIVQSIIQDTKPFAEACAVGDVVRIDTTTGKWTKANASAAGEARAYGVLASKDGAGAVGTAIRKGVLDGFDLSGMDYDEAVFLSDTDATMADAAGTVTTAIVGRVTSAWAQTIGNAADKLLFVDL